MVDTLLGRHTLHTSNGDDCQFTADQMSEVDLISSDRFFLPDSYVAEQSAHGSCPTCARSVLL